MKKRPILYVDVTQLVHWEGKLTGIPRVMYELAILFRQNDNVRYVSWVKQQKCYCEVDYNHSVLNRGNGIRYLHDGEELSSADTDSDLSHHSPSVATQKSGKPLYKKVLHKAINGTKYISADLPEKIRETASTKKSASYKKAQFSKGDAVFIPWGEWWDNNFLSYLENIHTDGVHLSTIIHDVGPMVTPHLSGHSTESLSNYVRRIVPICEEVFVNSKCTRDSMIAWMKENGLDVPDVTVFVIGDDFKHSTPKKPDNSVFASSKLKGGDYLLTVGTVELKKNHIFFYYAYRLAYERGIELPKLVIAGRRGWGTETNISLMENDPLVKDKLVFQFDTSDEELAWLYDNALFSVFASFYEGWGMPLAESLFHGVPVISARSTSLVEIGDGIIDRFTQASTDEFLEAVTKMLDPKYRDQKLKQVKTYKPATWKETYKTISDKLIEKEML